MVRGGRLAVVRIKRFNGKARIQGEVETVLARNFNFVFAVFIVSKLLT